MSLLADQSADDKAFNLILQGCQLHAELHKMQFERVEHMAQSPIERLMMAALMNDFSLSAIGKVYWIAQRASPDLAPNENAIFIYPQGQVGRYRADFLIVDARWSPVTLAVVECDGHQFHEKTKDQAKRDRRRDRWMVAQGIKVLRFTGSEIVECAHSCSGEVADALGLI